jgi:hypothetical protein
MALVMYCQFVAVFLISFFTLFAPLNVVIYLFILVVVVLGGGTL